MSDYPDHFQSGPLPEVFSVPDYDSFIFQLFLIKKHLDSEKVSNCKIQTLGWVSTSEEFILGVPTHGVMYVLWDFESKGKINKFPIEWIKTLVSKDKHPEVLKLASLWNSPDVVIRNYITQSKSTSFVSRNPVLLKEYFRFNHINAILTYSNEYEYLNIVERWTMTLGGDVQSEDKDVIFSERKLELTYDGTKKLLEEIGSKKIRESVGVKLIESTREWLRQDNPITSVTITLTGRVLRLVPEVGKPYIYVFPEDLLNALLERGTLEQLACVCLRYACILQQAQQWANPTEFYDILVNKYSASIEGFASPLNSRIILQSKDAVFCSLFPDVDAPFGSVGSFFDQSYVGKTATICPPYTIFIFDGIYDKTLEQIEEAKKTGQSLRLVYGLPDWHDVKLIDFLETSEYVVYKKFVPNFEYSFFDSKNGAIIPATFANRYYILDIGNPENNYSEVFGKYFKDMKQFTHELRRKKRAITSKPDQFNYATIYQQIGKFEAVTIANALVYFGCVRPLMKSTDPGIVNWSTLFTYLLSEALLNLDPNNTRKYMKIKIAAYIVQEAKKYV